MTPSFEELRDHIAQNFVGFHRKSDGPFRRLDLEAKLQREDTRFGCYLPVRFFNSQAQLLLEIPRDTHDGEHFEIDLSAIGIHNLMLNVRVVVV
jgi:hypothetical protein